MCGVALIIMSYFIAIVKHFQPNTAKVPMKSYFSRDFLLLFFDGFDKLSKKCSNFRWLLLVDIVYTCNVFYFTVPDIA